MVAKSAETPDVEKLANDVVAGKSGAEKKLAAVIGALAKKRPGYYGNTTASEIFDCWNIITENALTSQKTQVFTRTLPIFLAALEMKPYILPHALRARDMFGAAGVDLLLKCFEIGLQKTPRKGIETIDKGIAHAAGDGFRMLESVFDRLVDYGPSPYIDKAGDDVALAAISAGLANMRWSNDRLWVLFRVLAENQFGSHLKKSTGAVFLPLLDKVRAAKITGDGVDKLTALLARSGHGSGKKTVATLPKKFPDDVKETLALIKKWRLTKKDLLLGKPATPAQLKSLAKELSLALPGDLKQALALHSQVGEVCFGPPGRMAGLRDEIAETLAEHLKEYSALKKSKDYRDVRDYQPLKRGIPLGTNSTGDIYFLATNARSASGYMPVIRFHHGEALTSSVAADSLGEYLAMEIAQPYARREGLESEYYALLGRKRTAKL